MRLFYEYVGRAVVGSFIERWGRGLRTAGALGVAASVLGLGLYLATREHDDAAS